MKKSSVGGNKYTKDYGSTDAAPGYFNGVGVNMRLVGYSLSVSRYQGIFSF
jgi:hypothetical protein